MVTCLPPLKNHLRQPVKKYSFKRPKPRNLEAKSLQSPQFSLKVIPVKLKKLFRKRKHKGSPYEKD
jgi:hypothetical protein